MKPSEIVTRPVFWFSMKAETVPLTVTNMGDRPNQIGSHYHFFEANEALSILIRNAALGKRLDIPAGTAFRFEPWSIPGVTLIDYAGDREITWSMLWFRESWSIKRWHMKQSAALMQPCSARPRETSPLGGH